MYSRRQVGDKDHHAYIHIHIYFTNTQTLSCEPLFKAHQQRESACPRLKLKTKRFTKCERTAGHCCRQLLKSSSATSTRGVHVVSLFLRCRVTAWLRHHSNRNHSKVMYKVRATRHTAGPVQNVGNVTVTIQHSKLLEQCLDIKKGFGGKPPHTTCNRLHASAHFVSITGKGDGRM